MRYFVEGLDYGNQFAVLPLAIAGVTVPREEAVDAFVAGEIKADSIHSTREAADARAAKLNNRGK